MLIETLFCRVQRLKYDFRYKITKNLLNKINSTLYSKNRVVLKLHCHIFVTIILV